MSSNVTQDNAVILRPGAALRGEVTVPGDKSISHRAVLFGAIADGTSHVQNWLAAGDTEASLRVIQQLGVVVEREDKTTLTIHGGNLSPASEPLDFVNAGTGIRLAAGIMAGQAFESVLDGSSQLRKRPMKRIIDPLQLMGADISSENLCAPMHIRPSQLQAIEYELPVASAQVKSAILLAGLFADGTTRVIEPGPARDHTERMLRAMGADLTVEGNIVSITPVEKLHPVNLSVPGDFSSAAFLLVAGTIIPHSDLLIKHVNLNPTRTGLLDVLLEMGADIQVTPNGMEADEPVGDLRVRHSELQGVEIGGDMVVRMIDEFPILMIAALCAKGETVVRDAKELRVKETDRLAVMTAELRKMGAEITELDDGFIIRGRQELDGNIVDGHDDHRIAMSLTIAGLLANEQTVITDAFCAGDSFPGFFELIRHTGGQVLEHNNI